MQIYTNGIAGKLKILCTAQVEIEMGAAHSLGLLSVLSPTVSLLL